MCSATLANTCEYIYFQASQTHPQEFHFWNMSEMIICCRDKNMIQIVKQEEKFCMLACHTLSPEKFMVPQDLQVESQDIPVLNTVPGTGGCALPESCWNLYKPLKCLFFKKKKKPHTQKSKSCSSYFSSYSVRFTHLRVPAFQKALTASGLGDLSLLLLVWLSVSGHPCHQQPDLSSFLAFLPPNSLPL